MVESELGRHPRRRRLTLGVLGTVVLVTAGGLALTRDRATATTTSTGPTSTATTVAIEQRQPGWTVASSSARGVLVDFRNLKVGTVTFRALRLRARTTLLRWHVGFTDPSLHAGVPVDAGPAIDWPSEGRAGVVAVFNGGFKQAALAGGSVVDGVTLAPLVRGDMTIALDAAGHWAMGVWGSANFPPAGFAPISYRQNLTALVQRGALTRLGTSSDFMLWGSPLHGQPLEARSGLGEDAQGNLIYVATMKGVLQTQVGEALIAAGAVTGMELDINPFWPVLGASFVPLHSPGALPVQLPLSMHSPTVFETGWQRDFFVALAEPPSWTCHWASAGVNPALVYAQPQPLHLVGRCQVPVTTTTTTNPTSTTSTTVAPTSSTSSAPNPS